jgi:hypothetical protein
LGLDSNCIAAASASIITPSAARIRTKKVMKA